MVQLVEGVSFVLVKGVLVFVSVSAEENDGATGVLVDNIASVGESAEVLAGAVVGEDEGDTLCRSLEDALEPSHLGLEGLASAGATKLQGERQGGLFALCGVEDDDADRCVFEVKSVVARSLTAGGARRLAWFCEVEAMATRGRDAFAASLGSSALCGLVSVGEAKEAWAMEPEEVW